MKTYRDLRDRLHDIHGRGYPGYKGLRGVYDMDGFDLSIDHVQGDPFASPSSLSVYVPAAFAQFPTRLFATTARRVALEDHLVRRFGAALGRFSFRVGGSGKSGLLATSRPGPEVLRRSACCVHSDGGVTMCLEAGFPARGRTVDAEALDRMLIDFLPVCVEDTLYFTHLRPEELQAVADLADDQEFLRAELERRGLVAFVADGSILPRESGVSKRPLKGAVPFTSPDTLAHTLELPHRGPVRGMGVPRGVTLIVGGGYHGKTTLLEALQEGVYNHIAGDGRELVVTDDTAVKLRAEDGRCVHGVDVSAFISDIPSGADTRRFRTSDASGSTSQAASLIESLETGSTALLLDEDTSATNFMVRDSLMAEVVAKEKEPITPFVERVRELHEDQGVSTVLVAGSSGAFFFVADTVIQMDNYQAKDVTEAAKAACAAHPGACPRTAQPAFPLVQAKRFVRTGNSENPGRHDRKNRHDDRLKVKTRERELWVGTLEANLSLVEQLCDYEQVETLAQAVRWALERDLLASHSVCEVVDLVAGELGHGFVGIDRDAQARCGMALPRKQEIAACFNRLRP